MRIWHDNSGSGNDASWYLKYIIVYDLQTKEKFYSFCEQWLATEKGDGKIDRNLFFVNENEFTENIKRNVTLKDKFSDFHLWYSVFAKPVGSLFTRLNRVTCCFLYSYSSMFLLTLYYKSKYTLTKSSILLNSTFFNLTQEQVNIFVNYL
jgi:hypothetical protein